MGDPLERYRRGAREALDRLQEKIHGEEDEEAVWIAVAEACGALYRWQEYIVHNLFVPSNSFSFWAARAATLDGRTLGAILWLRGLVEHHGTSNHTPVWVPSKGMLWLSADGEWRRTEPYALDAKGSWRPVRLMRAVLGWPHLPPVAPDRFHRDEWYADLVAGKALMAPLEAAVRFLATFSGPAL